MGTYELSVGPSQMLRGGGGEEGREITLRTLEVRLTIICYSFKLLVGERLCECMVHFPRTKPNDPITTKIYTSQSHVQGAKY